MAVPVTERVSHPMAKLAVHWRTGFGGNTEFAKPNAVFVLG